VGTTPRSSHQQLLAEMGFDCRQRLVQGRLRDRSCTRQAADIDQVNERLQAARVRQGSTVGVVAERWADQRFDIARSSMPGQAETRREA